LADDFSVKTVNPFDPEGDRVEVVIPGDLITRQYKYSSVDWHNLRAVKFVLENPLRIFKGVRDYETGGYCYVGRPPEWHIREKVVVPFPKRLVYAVYVNPNMRLYEHRAEKAAADDPLCPVDWADRYGALLWKSTS